MGCLDMVPGSPIQAPQPRPAPRTPCCRCAQSRFGPPGNASRGAVGTHFQAHQRPAVRRCAMLMMVQVQRQAAAAERRTEEALRQGDDLCALLQERCAWVWVYACMGMGVWVYGCMN